MEALSEKERLLRALSRQARDRPPVIAPGGMMSSLTADLLKAHGIDGSQAMNDGETMAQAALVAREVMGLENLGVPFCLTVEAEALGGITTPGTTTLEPMLVRPVLPSADDVSRLKIPEPQDDRRMSEVLEAIRILKSAHPDVPVIGNLSGPITLATCIVNCDDFLRILLRDKTLAMRVIDVATETIGKFGAAMIEAGADVIAIGDPTASGEILGPRTFATMLLPEYQKLFSVFHAMGARTILHICGNVRSILPSINSTGADAFSVDSMMSIRLLRKELGSMPLMGNTSTVLLAKGKPNAITRAMRAIMSEGVDILAPSCGLGRDTPIENVRLMCQTAKTWERGQAGEDRARGEPFCAHYYCEPFAAS